MQKQLNVRIDEELVNFMKLESAEIESLSLNEFTEMILAIGALCWTSMRNDPQSIIDIFARNHLDRNQKTNPFYALREYYKLEIERIIELSKYDDMENAADEAERSRILARYANRHAYMSLLTSGDLCLYKANLFADHLHKQIEAEQAANVLPEYGKSRKKSEFQRYGNFPYRTKKAKDLIEPLQKRDAERAKEKLIAEYFSPKLSQEQNEGDANNEPT